MSDETVKLNPVQTILNHAVRSEPSQMKSAVGAEVASRVMNIIQTKRTEIGGKMFGK